MCIDLCVLRCIDLSFPFLSRNALELLNLNLPDVCTASPQHGQAFCKEHCLLIQKEAAGVPTALRDFLKYCGSLEAAEG